MSKKRGFTLIELLVVIAIIGIPSSIILVALRGARNKAKDARITADLSQYRSLAEVQYAGSAYVLVEKTALEVICDSEEGGAGLTGDELSLCNDIADQGGNLVVTLASPATEYMAYSGINESATQWYCVDSTGYAGIVETTEPAGTACQ